MTKILTIVIFLIATCSAAQKTFKIKKQYNDTIDFSNLNSHTAYNLTVIKQFDGQQVFDLAGRQLVFLIRDSTSLLTSPPNDTIMFMPWNSDYRDVHKTNSHDFGVIGLNKQNNTISTLRNVYDRKTKQYVTKKKIFKVLKWTFYELIIKDFTNTDFNRTYYFKRGTPH